MKKSWLFIVAFIVVVGVGGYVVATRLNANKSEADPSKLQVVTSFYPLYFFTAEIAGEKAQVHSITPAGAEPHDYEPTTQDVARIEDSALLVMNGARLEGWGDKMKDILTTMPVKIISVGEQLATQEIMEDGEVVRDPHVWLNPELAKKQVAIILQGLVDVDPVNTEYYTANADVLTKKLEELDSKFSDQLKICQKKDIITAHAAFGYLAKHYGFNQVAISGLSPDAEPSPRDLARVAGFAKENNVKYIFFESLVSPKLSEVIAQEVGAQTLVLNPLEGLSDEEIAEGKNYFTVMENNLTNLKVALECR